MQNLLGNLRYAIRQFRSSPVFTAAAVLTLALGIGGTTAIFTLIHAVTLRSLPVSDPGETLSRGRRRRLLRRRRTSGPLGNVFVPSVRTAEGRIPGI